MQRQGNRSLALALGIASLGEAAAAPPCWRDNINGLRELGDRIALAAFGAPHHSRN